MKTRDLMTKIALFTVAALVVATATAEEEGGSGRWNISVGPAWRSRVKSSISGRGSGPSIPASQTTTYDQDIAGHGPWSADEVGTTVPDPQNPGERLYAATRIGTETTVTPHSGATSLNDSDRDRPLGVSLSAGHDFYTSGRFSAGLSLRFAGYWDMKSHACGQAGGSTTTSRSWRDYHLFSAGPIPPDDDFEYLYPDSDPYLPYREDLGGAHQTMPGQRICARLSSDLYQIGIGPKLTWRAHDRIDLFGGVEALCNFSRLEVEYGEMSRSDTECLPGVGARLGLVAYLTDNVGFQIDAGYEWIDEADISLGGVRAEVDYSSFVTTAGITLRF
ncbi:MAG TPA: hypothetical protein P5527_09435 [Kiritimatiellia bacterium]|nr:hypothetical protein [Kiritimatiellia bacterium]